MTKTAIKRAEQKRKLIELFGGKCIRCNYDKNSAALDFHHRDGEEKEAQIGYFINFHRFADAVEEAKKCDLLCRNCHAEVHSPHLELEHDGDGGVRFINTELNAANKTCPQCGGYSAGQAFCSESCVMLANRKVKQRPSAEDLKEMLAGSSYSAVGRKYRVSDNAVRKWARLYGIIEA